VSGLRRMAREACCIIHRVSSVRCDTCHCLIMLYQVWFAGVETKSTGTYEDLKVWRRAMDLVLSVYRCTSSFPKQEVYGLTSQMRRSAVSVPSNIAEGKGRHSRKELVQFLFHARGSLLELRTQITISRELGFLRDDEGQTLVGHVDEVGRLLNGLINRFQFPPVSEP
jgi:four helix bundle protein